MDTPPVTLDDDGDVIFIRSKHIENRQSPASLAVYGDFRIQSLAQIIELDEKNPGLCAQLMPDLILAADAYRTSLVLTEQLRFHQMHDRATQNVILTEKIAWNVFIRMLLIEQAMYQDYSTTEELRHAYAISKIAT